MKYFDLEKFIKAQDKFDDYGTALTEMKEGEKRSHWIWYIFPQIKGLGRSGNAQYYAIQSLFEAYAYLSHPELGARIQEITKTLYDYNQGRDIEQVMGSNIDAIKLRSSMTLFDICSPNDIFETVLNEFFEGKRDDYTLKILTDEIKWLKGKSPLIQEGIERMQMRPLLEGIDGEQYSYDQKVATLLDLWMRGHSIEQMVKWHLVDKNDIHSTIRTSEIETHLSSVYRQLIIDILEKCGRDMELGQQQSLADLYNSMEQKDFNYCLDVAEMFDELLKGISYDSSIGPKLTEYINNNTLLKTSK